MPWGLISPFAWLRNACSRFSLSKTRTKNNTILSLSFQLSLYREHLQARTCFKMESEMNVRHKYSRPIFIIWVLRFISGMMTWRWKEFGRTGTRTRWIGVCDLGIFWLTIFWYFEMISLKWSKQFLWLGLCHPWFPFFVIINDFSWQGEFCLSQAQISWFPFFSACRISSLGAWPTIWWWSQVQLHVGQGIF